MAHRTLWASQPLTAAVRSILRQLFRRGVYRRNDGGFCHVWRTSLFRDDPRIPHDGPRVSTKESMKWQDLTQSMCRTIPENPINQTVATFPYNISQAPYRVASESGFSCQKEPLSETSRRLEALHIMPLLTYSMLRQTPFEKKLSHKLLKGLLHVGVFQEFRCLGFRRDCHLLFSHVYNFHKKTEKAGNPVLLSARRDDV